MTNSIRLAKHGAIQQNLQKLPKLWCTRKGTDEPKAEKSSEVIDNTNVQNSSEIDFPVDEVSSSESMFPEGEGNSEDGEDDERDPYKLHLTLKATNINGEARIELFAQDERMDDTDFTVQIATVTERELTMFPLNVHRDFSRILGPKYDGLKSITVVAEEDFPWELPKSVREFDELLTQLPVGFARIAAYGLGLRWEYRLIPEAILELPDVTELVIEPGNDASARPPKFHLGIDRFTSIRKTIDTISRRATARSLNARRLAAYNETLHFALPNVFERRFPEIKAGELYELVQLRTGAANRSARDGLAAVQVVQDDVQKIANEKPENLLKLKSIIEQVTLAQLIGKFESMMQGDLTESKWQAFLKANPFILGLAFPYPVIMFQDQASIGGTTIRGNGESIVDFLMAQRFTGNLALIEIKRPSTLLVESKSYRGDMHPPHRDLTAAMAQVLDQRAKLLHHYAAKKSQDMALADTHVSSVNCIVVVGTLPKDAAQIRSLDIFRHSSKDISVVTFDELLEKLKELHRLVSPGLPVLLPTAPASSVCNESDDLPF